MLTSYSLIVVFDLSEPYYSNFVNCHCLAFIASDQVSCCFCIYLYHQFLQCMAIMMVIHSTVPLYLLASHVVFWCHAYEALKFEIFYYLDYLLFYHLRYACFLFQGFSRML